VSASEYYWRYDKFVSLSRHILNYITYTHIALNGNTIVKFILGDVKGSNRVVYKAISQNLLERTEKNHEN
jgi:hypothetical protein